LIKKYSSLKAELTELNRQLTENPTFRLKMIILIELLPDFDELLNVFK